MKRVFAIAMLGLLSVTPMQASGYVSTLEMALVVQGPTAAQCSEWYSACAQKAMTAYDVCRNFLQGTEQECYDDYRREWEACSQGVQNAGCPPPSSSPSPREPCPYWMRLCLPDPR